MTPLLDALYARAARNTLRFHMPGHAGRAVIDGWEAVCALDFTELSDTGNLFADEPDSPIRAAELLFAGCYHATDCLFLTGGATQGIMTMLSAFTRPGDAVALDRNCHVSVHNALALMDLRPVWAQAPRMEPFGVTSGLPARALEAALDSCPGAACALITSPTYYGVLSDLPALAAVCAARGVPLLVDAAHGAHLPFLAAGTPTPSPAAFDSPVSQGAAAAVLSAHKTLPALGQSAFVLTGPGVSASLLRRRAALFGSSSPSYLLMASLDAARAYMEAGGRKAIVLAAHAADAIRQSSPHFLGYNGSAGNADRSLSAVLDPLRLCLFTGAGFDTADRLERVHGVVCEMAGPRSVILLLSALHTETDLARLGAALSELTRGLPRLPPIALSEPPPLPPVLVSPHQALSGRQVSVPWRAALGRAAAAPAGPYPPGAPLIARGEEVDAGVMEAFERVGFTGEILVLE